MNGPSLFLGLNQSASGNGKDLSAAAGLPQDVVPVTRPVVPPLEEFLPMLQDIWERRVLTNGGPYHQALETALCQHLGVPQLSLFSNGTLALVTALQALRISGEVITTPYSFVATSHALLWNGIEPVFADIDPQTFNLDPNRIEAAITPRTSAMLAVHCYGWPCDVQAIERIDHLKNFGFVDETTVVAAGINGKMSELHVASRSGPNRRRARQWI